VADPGSIAAGLGRIRAALPRTDILVNNAGIAESAPLAKTSPELWQRHLAVNATAPFLLSRALVPAMLERKWGRVVNIASLAGLGGAPYIAAYAASKHALVGLTRALAAETAGTGVTVNATCPGYVATEFACAGARRITIVERDGPHDTFGWGIVFSERALAFLREHDEETYARIAEASETWDNVDVVHRGRSLSVRGNGFSGIARLTFLDILHRRCLD